MNRFFYTLILLTTCFIALGQVRQKDIFDKSCSSLKNNVSTLLHEDIGFDEKEFTKYFELNLKDSLLQTPLDYEIIISNSHSVCCYHITIKDSALINQKQIELIRNTILKFPSFNKTRFKKGEVSKSLTVAIIPDKAKKYIIEFWPGMLTSYNK